MIYFDSSYIVRLYYEDRGFAAVRNLASTDSIASGQHARAEVIAALHRKHRDGDLTADKYQITLREFHNDAKAGGFKWLALSPSVLDRVETVYEQLPATVFLRAADALHLACAAENNFKKIYSNDEKLLHVAKYFGVEGVNVM